MEHQQANSIQEIKEQRSRIYHQTERIFEDILNHSQTKISDPFQLLHSKFKEKDKIIAQLKKDLEQVHERIKFMQNKNLGNSNIPKQAGQQLILPESSSSENKSSLNSSDEKQRMEKMKQKRLQLQKQKKDIEDRQVELMFSILSYVSLYSKFQQTITISQDKFKKMSLFYMNNSQKQMQKTTTKEIRQFIAVEQPRLNKSIADEQPKLNKRPQWIDQIKQDDLNIKFQKICSRLYITDLWENLKRQRILKDRSIEKMNQIKFKRQKNVLQDSTINKSMSIESIDLKHHLKLVQNIIKLAKILDATEEEIVYIEKICQQKTINKTYQFLIQKTFGDLEQQRIKKFKIDNTIWKKQMQKMHELFYKKINRLMSKHNQGMLWTEIPKINQQFWNLMSKGSQDQAYRRLKYDIDNSFDAIQSRALFFSSDKLYYYYKMVQ